MPVESFNGRLREECLRISWFDNLFDARRKIAAWLRFHGYGYTLYVTAVKHRREAYGRISRT